MRAVRESLRVRGPCISAFVGGWLRRSGGRIAPVALLAVPVLVWAGTGVGLEGPAALVLRRISVLFALLGFTTFTYNLVLVARLGFVERLFGGLDRLYLFHRRLAVATVSLLVLHAALVLASLGVARSLGGLGWKVAVGAVALGGLVVGVLVSFRARIRHEAFVWVQRGLGVVFGIGAVHALALSGGLGLSRASRTYLLALGALGGAAFVYRSVLGRVAVPRRRYRVAEVRRLDPGVAEIVLLPVGERLRFRAGQFAFLSVVGGSVSREAHPYSIASAPDRTELRFLVKALGDYTTKLQELEPGCVAQVEGPYGTFWNRGSDNPRQVWIAGGVGVAPFLAMAPSLDVGRSNVDLYYCTEGPEQAHLIEELFEIADRDPRLRVVPVRKRSLGHLTADDIDAASRDIADTDIFICGPPVMMRNLERQFLALGVPRSHIHFEDFSFL